jgi:uncharacterized membrane protein YphA (DoxX/SURF4 family)
MTQDNRSCNNLSWKNSIDRWKSFFILLQDETMMHKIMSRWARIIAAIILLQTLFFKFTAHPESVNLFSSIGMEPWWRIAIGVIELIVGLLLLFGGKNHRIGAVIGVWVMLGAIYFHLTILGIDSLFRMAVVTVVLCLYILRNQRRYMKHIYKQYARKYTK